MPTIARLAGGYRVVVYPNDHRPDHVHVVGADREAVFLLNCPDGPPVLRESFGFGSRDLTRIRDDLARVLSTLCDAWRRIHGSF